MNVNEAQKTELHSHIAFFVNLFFPCSDLIFWGLIREVNDSLGKSKKISGIEYYTDT